MLGYVGGRRAQVALEFLVVYSFVLIIFILIFSLVTSQRAVTLNQQQYSLMQLQSQNIASYIDQAAQAGSGYSATVPLISEFVNNYYNISVSTTGVVIAEAKIGRQNIIAYGFSHAKNLVINGTLQTNSNGIMIYQIPAYRGYITISNLKGTVYIDEEPQSVLQAAQGAVVTQMANVRSVSFNSVGKMNFIEVPNSESLTLGNSISISLWFYANGCGTIVGKQNSAGFSVDIISPCHTGYNPNDILSLNYMGSEIISTNVPSMNWINAVAVFDSANSIAYLYINGVYVANSPITNVLQQNSNTLYIGSGDALFNGSVADLQIYNGILDNGQIMSIYLDGIGGMPLNQNLVGWWPLDGNANDYSGLGNQGIPVNNPAYGTVIQLNAEVYSATDNALANVPIGFAASIGDLNGNFMYSSISTDTNGISRAFVTSVDGNGPGNVVAEVFNGNLSTVGNLVGWWPMDIGYGSNVQDLSQGMDTGTFNGKWTQYVNQTNFISPNYESSISCAGNSGPHSSSLTLNSTQSLFNIVNNDTFTVVAWAYPTSVSGERGIFGDWNGSNTVIGSAGFQLEAANSGNCIAMYVANTELYFPGACSFPENSWEMVAGEYNGNTGEATVYLNNTVLASTTLQGNLPLGINNTPYQIGYDLVNSNGNANFNGIITNVQLYDSYLTQKQIDSLYYGGLTTPPLGNSGLVGWWPLINTEKDYSYNNGNGTSSSKCPPGHERQPSQAEANIIYVNNVYNNTQSPVGPGIATFDGSSNVMIPYASKFAGADNAFTVSLWFSDFNGSAAQFNQPLPLLNVETGGGASAYHLDINVCGNYACNGLTGIHGDVGTGSGWLSTSIGYPFSFSKNTWYSVTEVFYPSRWELYLNGIEVSSGNYINIGTASLAGPGDSIYLGSAPGSSAGFTGQIADLQVYDSTLDKKQVMQLYAQGLPMQYRNNISVG